MTLQQIGKRFAIDSKEYFKLEAEKALTGLKDAYGFLEDAFRKGTFLNKDLPRPEEAVTKAFLEVLQGEAPCNEALVEDREALLQLLFGFVPETIPGETLSRVIMPLIISPPAIDTPSVPGDMLAFLRAAGQVCLLN